MVEHLLPWVAPHVDRGTLSRSPIVETGGDNAPSRLCLWRVNGSDGLAAASLWKRSRFSVLGLRDLEALRIGITRVMMMSPSPKAREMGSRGSVKTFVYFHLREDAPPTEY